MTPPRTLDDIVRDLFTARAEQAGAEATRNTYCAHADEAAEVGNRALAEFAGEKAAAAHRRIEVLEQDLERLNAEYIAVVANESSNN